MSRPLPFVAAPYAPMSAPPAVADAPVHGATYQRAQQQLQQVAMLLAQQKVMQHSKGCIT